MTTDNHNYIIKSSTNGERLTGTNINEFEIQTRFYIRHFQNLPIKVHPIIIKKGNRYMHKNYYRVISFYDTGFTDNVWHCSHETAASLKCDIIIPLERKPRNIPIREGN